MSWATFSGCIQLATFMTLGCYQDWKLGTSLVLLLSHMLLETLMVFINNTNGRRREYWLHFRSTSFMPGWSIQAFVKSCLKPVVSRSALCSALRHPVYLSDFWSPQSCVHVPSIHTLSRDVQQDALSRKAGCPSRSVICRWPRDVCGILRMYIFVVAVWTN